MIQPITNYMCKNLRGYCYCNIVLHDVICPYTRQFYDIKDEKVVYRIVYGNKCSCPHYIPNREREIAKTVQKIKELEDQLKMIIEDDENDTNE